MRKKVISLIPFIIVCIIMLVNWMEIIFTTIVATWQHYVTLVLVTANAVCYFWRYKPALIGTGIILVLATFNLLTFYAATNTWFFGINIGGGNFAYTPGIQLWSLLILVLYGMVNFDRLVNWYLDAKDAKQAKQNSLK